VLLVASGAAAAAQPKITSAYTKLDLDRCTQLDHGETPESTEWRCPGYRGTALFVQNGDERYDVDAGLADEDAFFADTFDYPGETVEWRLLGSKPFAIIYRLNSANPDRPKTTSLVIETVGRPGRPGCRVAKIDGARPGANLEARRIADTQAGPSPYCVKPE
jgi:hypothetical protein